MLGQGISRDNNLKEKKKDPGLVCFLGPSKGQRTSRPNPNLWGNELQVVHPRPQCWGKEYLGTTISREKDGPRPGLFPRPQQGAKNI